MSEPLLTVRNLSAGYGSIIAVRDISFSVMPGQTVAIVGANGAGKSTIMRALSGMIPCGGGDYFLAGRRMNGGSAFALVRAGLLHVPEGRGTLTTLTVEDNMRLAHEMKLAGGAESFEAAAGRVYARFPRLHERRDQLAGNLSGGEQQMLSLSRAILSPPRLLLVDEPSLGLAPRMVSEVFKVLHDFKASGMSILVVEQNVRKALQLADQAFILRHGEFAASGSGAELLADPETFEKYLGKA